MQTTNPGASAQELLERVSLAQAAFQRARRERLDAFDAAYAAGASTGEIARAAGVSQNVAWRTVRRPAVARS